MSDIYYIIISSFVWNIYIILPSFHFNSELAFLNAYKPKLFEDFTIVIQEADDGYCFKSAAGKLVVSAMTILATVFFAIAMI